MNNLLIGILAGVISAALALVFASVIPLAIISSYIPLLPILIVTLGWRHQTGIVAAFTGAVVCTFGGSLAALIYLVCIGLPAWGIGYLCLLGRRTENGMEWYPTGHILFWIVCLVVVQTFLSVVAVSNGNFDAYLLDFKARLVPIMEVMGPQFRASFENPSAFDQWQVSMAIKAPGYAAQVGLMITICVVWLAGRITARRNRLPRPLPFIPAMRMPAWIIIVALAGFCGIVFLDDMAAIGAHAIFYPALTALCLQGLAMLHDISRRWKQRRLMLWLSYIAVLLFPFAILGSAVFGAADILTDIRTKFGGTNMPPTNISKL